MSVFSSSSALLGPAAMLSLVVWRVGGISVVVAALLGFVIACGAFAKGRAGQSSDPGANTPAGVIYSIPLDSARTDAAPHGHSAVSLIGTGGGGGSSSGGGTGSAGGGSAVVATPSSARAASGRTTKVLVPGGEPGSLVHSANGFGSSSQVPGLAQPSPAGLGAVQSNGGSAPTLAYALAGITLLAGLGIGSRSRWTSLRRSLDPGSDGQTDRRPPEQ